MIKLFIKGFVLIIILLAQFSCNRIKNESKQIYEDSKIRIKTKKDDIVDNLISTFDPYHPDTKYNRKRFAEFFMFDPPEDVKNIYCYADEMGVDHKYQFSFNCNSSTVSKIVDNLQLAKGNAPENQGDGLWSAFPWWDNAVIEALEPYYRSGQHETYWYLWYDSAKQKAYYFSFDM